MTKRKPTKRRHWSARWAKMDACRAGLREAREYKSADAWWRATKRGDWMMWVLVRIKPEAETTSLSEWMDQREHLICSVFCPSLETRLALRADIIRSFYPKFPTKGRRT